MKKIFFTLDWDFGTALSSSSKGLGEITKVRIAGEDLQFIVKQTRNKIIIQADLLDWYRNKREKFIRK